MENESVLLIDRWLQHEVYGVEAHLPNVPRETPEGGTDPMPEMPVVVNDVEDEDVIERIEPDAKIALVVFCQSGPEVDMDSGSNLRQIGEDIDIVIAYITRDIPKREARRNCGYVLRAVTRCLTDYNSSRKAADYRSLNGYKVANVARWKRWKAAGGVGDSSVWGFIVVTLVVLDPEP